MKPFEATILMVDDDETLHEIDPRIAILIFISGFCDLLPADAISMGARRFFEKPFDRTEFMNEVKKSISEIAEIL